MTTVLIVVPRPIPSTRISPQVPHNKSMSPCPLNVENFELETTTVPELGAGFGITLRRICIRFKLASISTSSVSAN